MVTITGTADADTSGSRRAFAIANCVNILRAAEDAVGYLGLDGRAHLAVDWAAVPRFTPMPLRRMLLDRAITRVTFGKTKNAILALDCRADVGSAACPR